MRDVGKNNFFDVSRSGVFKRTSSGMRGERFLRAWMTLWEKWNLNQDTKREEVGESEDCEVEKTGGGY